MLSDEAMRNMFRDAEEEGYITDLMKAEECNSGCETCPAGDACEQLAEGKDYKKFVKNYKELWDGCKETNETTQHG